MKLPATFGVVAVVAVAATWAVREDARGTFNFLSSPFLSWLAANASATVPMPPLTLVLYDEESSELAGANRMALLDGALFARAAARLGAVAAGVEGLQGDPRRMIEAARGMPVFGGYAPESPPDLGWTPLRGEPGGGWPEVGGLAGRPSAFARGFLSAPAGGDGAREILLVARNADRAIPSFLVLAWGAAQGLRARDLWVAPGAVEAAHSRMPFGDSGSAWFIPGAPPEILTMNELLVEAERYEREGGMRPRQGHMLVLARATPDVVRVEGAGTGPVTQAELWAQSWDSVRQGRLFIPPGWWFTPALVIACSLAALSPVRRSGGSAFVAGMFSLLVFILCSLGAYAGARILLPAGPAVIAIVAAIVSSRVAHRTGWLGE